MRRLSEAAHTVTADTVFLYSVRPYLAKLAGAILADLYAMVISQCKRSLRAVHQHDGNLPRIESVGRDYK